MKINNLGYLLKEGFRGIFLRWFSSSAAVVVTMACLLIVGTCSILMYNVSHMVEKLNKTNEIIVYVDEDLSDAEAKSVGTDLNQVDNVYKAEFITREEALDDFKQDHDDNDALAGVQPEDLRYRFRVVLEDNSKMEQTVADIESIDGVVNISAPYALAKGFSALQNVLRVFSIAAIAVLLLISLVIISNTVKLAMYDRREEIAIMKMVGATNGFIRLPFVVQGFVLGMVGAGAAFGIEWLLYDLMLDKMRSIRALQMFEFVPFRELLMPMVFTFVAAGLFVGMLGSWTSIRKFMNASAK